MVPLAAALLPAAGTKAWRARRPGAERACPLQARRPAAAHGHAWPSRPRRPDPRTVQVTLVEPIFPQNLVDSGHLLILDVTTCFMTFVVLNDDVQVLELRLQGR